MGNSECCEEEAKGGEFKAGNSRFQTNKINLEPNKFNNINFADPPRNIKYQHDNQPSFNALASPSSKVSKSKYELEDLPIIKEEILNSKKKSNEENEHHEARESKEQQNRIGSVLKQQQSNHQSLLHAGKPDQTGQKLEFQHEPSISKSLQGKPVAATPNNSLLQEKEKISEIHMPELSQAVQQTLDQQQFFKEQLSSTPSRRQYQDNYYEGQLDETEKLPHGIGKYYKSDKSLFIGHFIKGKAQGDGALIFPDGSYYHGSFVNNTAEGKGVYKSSLLRYEGEFSKNCFHGHGSETGPSHKFVGEYYNGQKTNGVLTWTEDEKTFEYTGTFDHNLFNGEGKLIQPTGTYKGEFIQGKKHGHGVYEFKNGLKYDGEYKQGLRSGKGTLYNPNNKIAYEGDFHEGLPHGTGVVLDRNGKRCTTTWVEGIDAQLL